jgi:hypothetical protein
MTSPLLTAQPGFRLSLSFFTILSHAVTNFPDTGLGDRRGGGLGSGVNFDTSDEWAMLESPHRAGIGPIPSDGDDPGQLECILSP